QGKGRGGMRGGGGEMGRVRGSVAVFFGWGGSFFGFWRGGGHGRWPASVVAGRLDRSKFVRRRASPSCHRRSSTWLRPFGWSSRAAGSPCIRQDGCRSAHPRKRCSREGRFEI